MGLSPAKLDILREVGGIGVGKAATALSSILDKKVNVEIEETKLVPMAEFTDFIGGAEKIVVDNYSEMTGDMKGILHLLFLRENALKIIDIVNKKKIGETKIIESMDESAFKEIANILFGTYMPALSNMLEIKILFSSPIIAHDIAGAIIDFSLIKLATKVEKILTIKTSLKIEQKNIDGNMIMLLEDEYLEKIIKKIEEKYLSK